MHDFTHSSCIISGFELGRFINFNTDFTSRSPWSTAEKAELKYNSEYV